MNDFFESLQEIKKELKKEQKQKELPKKPKPNPNRDEFREIFKDEEENLGDKEARLQDEFLNFIKHCDVRKI